MAQTASQIGDNSLPLLTEADLRDEFKPLADQVDALEADARKLPNVVEDDEDLAAAQAMAERLRKAVKAVDDKRDERKRRYLDASNLVQRHFKSLEGKLTAAKLALEASARSYLTKKADKARAAQRAEEQRQRDEAARLAAQATETAKAGDLKAAVETQKQSETASARADNASAAAASKPANLARTTTEQGTATLVDNWEFKIEDLTRLDLNLIRHHFGPRDIEAAIGRFVKTGGRDLPGVKIFSAPKVRL